MDHTVTVELKNDLCLRGTLKSVDQYLNIKLDDISVEEEMKYPHLVNLTGFLFFFFSQVLFDVVNIRAFLGRAYPGRLVVLWCGKKKALGGEKWEAQSGRRRLMVWMPRGNSWE